MSLPTPPSPMPISAPRQRASRSSSHDALGFSDNSRTLTVHSGITIRGTLENVERLIVEGTVDIERLTVKELILAPDSLFRGVVEAGSAEISGTLDGSLSTRNTLTIRATGRLLGDAECRRLQVDEGGQVMGKLDMVTTPLPGKEHNNHQSSAPQNNKAHKTDSKADKAG